jgi:hypothetical protein
LVILSGILPKPPSSTASLAKASRDL